jgi:hypothetical protein
MKQLTKSMLLAILALGLLGSVNVYAEDWLSKPEIHSLLSGNTAKGHYEKRARHTARMVEVGVEIRFYADGTAEQTTERFGASEGRYTEAGEWSVNKKGALCTTWRPENKKRCRRIRRASDGGYEWVGKTQTIVFDEVIPGT